MLRGYRRCSTLALIVVNRPARPSSGPTAISGAPMRPHKTWHDSHTEGMSAGARIADHVANFIGSWRFIIIQSGIFVVWVIFNTLWLVEAWQFDPYPFILFNLFMSAEAAYASPLILMSQNRGRTRPRTGPARLRHQYR